jgi:hypothetical protein
MYDQQSQLLSIVNLQKLLRELLGLAIEAGRAVF